MRTKIEFTCLTCGKRFQDFKTNERTRKYCSEQCFYEGSKKFPPDAIRNYPIGWLIISEEIRERANHVCELCGNPNKEGLSLKVHHKIKPRYFIKNPQDAHKPENLIALCAICHIRVERALPPANGER